MIIEKKRNSWLCVCLIVMFVLAVCSCSRDDTPGAGDRATEVGDKITAAGENLLSYAASILMSAGFLFCGQRQEQ